MSLPISLNMFGRLAVIVGGGAIALRKLHSLLEAGADVRIIAPHAVPEMQALIKEQVTYREKTYEREDIDGAFLVIAATNNGSVNARIVADAQKAGTIVIDATDGDRGDAIMLASAKIGDVTIAIDSGGSTPAFAKRMLQDAQAMLGDAYGRAARVLGHARTYVKLVLSLDERTDVLRTLSNLPIEQLAAMNTIEIEHEVEGIIARQRGSGKHYPRAVICASRSSSLALTQTRTVAAQLAQRGIATTILQITTTGDRFNDRPIAALGTENVFVKELEFALRDKRADYAVHSCKDLPTKLPTDMHIAAISVREDPRDAYCSERYATFLDLPAGARVGTSSPRRLAQLTALRGDLRYEEIRGNVDTRLHKLHEGEYDAVVLAMAGLNRLHAHAKYTVPFEVDVLVPATGQGALVAETRTEDMILTQELYDALNDTETEMCVHCERAALRALRGGCRSPVGIHAYFNGTNLVALGSLGAVRAQVEAAIEGPYDAEALGQRLALELEHRRDAQGGAPAEASSGAPAERRET